MSSFQQKIILADVLKLNVEQVLNLNIQELNTDQKAEYQNKIEQLQRGIPLDYILGKVKIGDLEFTLNSKTLIPRPETEEWIIGLKNDFENIKQTTPSFRAEGEGIRQQDSENSVKQNNKTLIDLGCGCGLIGLSLAKFFGQVILLDIEPECLRATEQNAINNNIQNCQTLQSNGLESLDKNIQNWILISNPPYLPSSDKGFEVENKIEFEPSLALYSGIDGLELFGQILEQMKEFQNLPEQIHFELDPRNVHSAKTLIQKAFSRYNVQIKKDLNGLDRFLEGNLL
jgi:release factor glutamine methyltransferase